MEASSVWSEELFVDDPDAYVSLSLALFPGACLDRYGLQPGEDVAASSNAAHGYGLGGLIRYLVGTYGMDRMRAIWANIKIDAHPVAAIISAVGEQPGVSGGPHYLDQYLVGDIYNQTGAAFQPMVVDSFVIAGNADTEHVFTAEYPDISARLFKIKLENADLHDDAILNFAVDGQDPVPDLTVFKRQGPDIELLTRGQGAVSITDVRDLMQSGWEVLVLVQNCKATPPDYDGSRVLSLRVRQAVQPSWQRAYIRISLDAMVRDGEGVVQQQEDLVFWAQAAVSQMGTSINEVWLEPVAGGTETGEMEVYFNPTYTKIDSFRFVRNVQYDNGGTAHQAARGEDIAFDESDGTMDFYRYEGLQAQAHVGQLEHHFDLGYNSRELESIIWDVETNNISIVLDDLPPVRMHRRSEQAGSLTR